MNIIYDEKTTAELIKKEPKTRECLNGLTEAIQRPLGKIIPICESFNSGLDYASYMSKKENPSIDTANMIATLQGSFICSLLGNIMKIFNIDPTTKEGEELMRGYLESSLKQCKNICKKLGEENEK